jgi:hypothetical protein
LEGTAIEKAPSLLVVTVAEEPFTKTVTPCNGSLDAWSTILPVMVFCWADNVKDRSKSSNAGSARLKRVGFIMASFFG